MLLQINMIGGTITFPLSLCVHSKLKSVEALLEEERREKVRLEKELQQLREQQVDGGSCKFPVWFARGSFIP